MPHSVIAFYAGYDALLAAVGSAREARWGEIRTISPVPLPGIDGMLASRPSPVRWFALTGGLLGLCTGWALTIGSVQHYPLITGGKPLISATPFGVVAYICTILFGALFTVAGMLLNARLPRFPIGRGYDPRLTGNRFGLQILCREEQIPEVSSRLLASGAEEVKYVEV